MDEEEHEIGDRIPHSGKEDWKTSSDNAEEKCHLKGERWCQTKSVYKERQ